jgi:hypothetical protein
LKPESAKEEYRRLAKSDSDDKSGDIDDNSRYIAIHHSGDFMFIIYAEDNHLKPSTVGSSSLLLL